MPIDFEELANSRLHVKSNRALRVFGLPVLVTTEVWR